MSANIHWRRCSIVDPRLPVGAPSRFLEQMTRAGMDLPCEVGPEHIDRLIGLKAAHSGSDEDNPFAALIEVIEKNGHVALRAEY